MNCAWPERGLWYWSGSRLRKTPRANGLGGQILELLRYRGLLDRFEAASTDPSPARRFPFGGEHLDFSRVADPPLQGLPLPQPRLERLLGERAGELGADIQVPPMRIIPSPEPRVWQPITIPLLDATPAGVIVAVQTAAPVMLSEMSYASPGSALPTALSCAPAPCCGLAPV